MLKQIVKTVTIKGTSIYALNENDVAEPLPAAIDVTVTVPSIEFETTEINGVMGSMTVSDDTRVSNIQISANVAADNERTQALYGRGVKGWKIAKVVESVRPNGELVNTGFYYYCHGYVQNIAESPAETGGDGKADLIMNCISIRKIDSTGKEYYNFERLNGKIVINGVDYRSEIDNLLG
jgi:hypothetical protein